jgi:hypothetical protein
LSKTNLVLHIDLSFVLQLQAIKCISVEAVEQYTLDYSSESSPFVSCAQHHFFEDVRKPPPEAEEEQKNISDIAVLVFAVAQHAVICASCARAKRGLLDDDCLSDYVISVIDEELIT